MHSCRADLVRLLSAGQLLAAESPSAERIEVDYAAADYLSSYTVVISYTVVTGDHEGG